MNRPSPLTLVSLILITLIVGSSNLAAITVDNFSPATNQRFANNTAFIANDFNLSGISITDNGRWVTMVSPNVFLSAHHFFPSNSTSLTFYQTNDLNGTSSNRTILSSQRIGTSDLRIGLLDQPLSKKFTYYNFATQDTTNNNTLPFGPNAINSESFVNSPYKDAIGFHFGKNPGSLAGGNSTLTVGQNRIDTFFENVTAAGTTDDAIGSEVNPSTSPVYVAYEAFLQGGDSGAPLMVDGGNNELILVGINWFVAQNADNTKSFNGASYVGNYDVQIQAFIDANAALVPEASSTIFLISLASLALTVTRRPLRSSLAASQTDSRARGS
ncbi:MAG: hypothetical protein ACFCU4_10495 [Puniceicoccaceae bacterium]